MSWTKHAGLGGNGYSREFPAERAYRDADHAYLRGTNEINRLIVGTRLAKSSA